jgi:hypothetical protein
MMSKAWIHGNGYRIDELYEEDLEGAWWELTWEQMVFLETRQTGEDLL